MTWNLCTLKFINQNLQKGRFAHTNFDDYLSFDLIGFDNLVSVDSTPRWDVLQGAGICAGHYEFVTLGKVFDLVLGFDYRHGTEQVSGIEFMDSHGIFTPATRA